MVQSSMRATTFTRPPLTTLVRMAPVLLAAARMASLSDTPTSLTMAVTPLEGVISAGVSVVVMVSLPPLSREDKIV